MQLLGEREGLSFVLPSNSKEGFPNKKRNTRLPRLPGVDIPVCAGKWGIVFDTVDAPSQSS
jgi:hypothetical protein